MWLLLFDYVNTRLLFWLLWPLWPFPRLSTSFLPFVFYKHGWWFSTLFIALTQATSWVHYFEELHVYVTFMALRSLHTNNSPDPSLNLAQFISDFVTFLVFSHCSTLVPRLTIPWKENIPDFANSNKYMKGNSSFQNWQFVIGLIATIFSYGAQCLSMFEENDIGPWNTHSSNYGNQNWIFHLFRKCSSPGRASSIVNLSPIPDNLVYVPSGERKDGNTPARTSELYWILLYLSTEFDSGHFSKIWAPIPGNAMNRLSSSGAFISVFKDAMDYDVWHNISQRPALQAIDGAIAFRRGKSIGRVRPFKSPWMLTHRLTSHVRQILLTWFHGIKNTAVTFHEPSFKVVFSKHPSLMDAICNHKDAIQNWSDDIAPTCQCAILRQYPTARAHPNLDSEHWVLDGALLGPLLPGALGQMVGGSLNNKIFPNKKTLKKLFLDAFYLWCKQNAIPCPPERWLNNSTQCGLTTKPDFQTTLLQPPFDNFRINFQTVFSTMRTNEPPPFEFFAHANIFPASTRLSVIPLFLRAHRKLQQPAYRLLCNTCGTNLRRATPGPWELETSYPQATSWPKERSNMPQDAQLLVFLQHLSSQCWVH